MTKETTIIFIYDTELLKREEDDPNSAILYFYPTWVSDQQKTALCGQLMGTIRCLKSIFSMPKVVSLQTGKFFIIENVQFLLAVGSDRNIPNWVLDYRANLFYSLLNFFHKDFINLSLLYKKAALSAKLYHIFDTYLKLMLFGGNIFSQVSMLELPKSGSTVFMEAVAFLDRCRDFPNALGGTILYHNKVVATHLSASTTKKIVLSDPYRIKNPAETVETNFELPFGVQLLQVYVTNKEFCSLHESAFRSRCILQHLLTKKSKRPCQADNTQDIQEPSTSLLKRDTSLLFTSVAEEDGENPPHSSVTYRQNAQRRSRPNSLNLRSHNFDLNESKLNSKVSPMSSYCSQSSVASTPMTESKKFLHQEPSNFINKKNLSLENLDKPIPDQEKGLDHPLRDYCSRKSSDVCSEQRLDLTQISDKIDLVNESQSDINTHGNSEEVKGIRTLPVELTRAFFQSMRQKKPFRRCSSQVDLSEVITSISNDSNQYLRLKNRLISLPKRSIRLKRSKSIHDPIFPNFKHDGSVASQYYFEEMPGSEFLAKKITLDGTNGRIYPKDFVKMITRTDINKDEDVKSDLNQIICPKLRKTHRKSLTLPLKPLNSTEEHKTERKYSTGVQLTPLMNKLTILAFEEQTKPGRMSTSQNLYGIIPSKDPLDLSKSKKDKHLLLPEDTALQKCVLFICGQQDAVLVLLLQEDCSKDRETIEKLWETCTEQLPRLERQINYCLQSDQSKVVPHSTELYSFLSIDSEWDTVKRGGPWDNEDLSKLSRLYGDFRDHEEITDIILRNPESVIYGHQFGSSQLFYHESAAVINGLVTPNDAIGQVHHKARKNLERDHNIVLP